MRLILCFLLMVVTVPGTAQAADFWKDVAALYKEVRAIDSRLEDGSMIQKEFIEKYHDWKASYTDFMDTYDEKSCKMTDIIKAPTDEIDVCNKFKSVLSSYGLAESVLLKYYMAKKDWNNGEGLSDIAMLIKIQESKDQYEKATGSASSTIKKIKTILNKHR